MKTWKKLVGTMVITKSVNCHLHNGDKDEDNLRVGNDDDRGDEDEDKDDKDYDHFLGETLKRLSSCSRLSKSDQYHVIMITMK